MEGIVMRTRCPNGDGRPFQGEKFCSKCGAETIEVGIPGCSNCDYMWGDDDVCCPHCGSPKQPPQLNADEMAGVKRGLEDHRAGRVSPWAKVKAKLGLALQ